VIGGGVVVVVVVVVVAMEVESCTKNGGVYAH